MTMNFYFKISSNLFPNFPKITPKFFQNYSEIFSNFLLNFPNITPKFSLRNFTKITQKFLQKLLLRNFIKITLKFFTNYSIFSQTFFLIFSIFLWNSHFEISPKVLWNFPKLLQNFPKRTKFFFLNYSEIYFTLSTKKFY